MTNKLVYQIFQSWLICFVYLISNCRIIPTATSIYQKILFKINIFVVLTQKVIIINQKETSKLVFKTLFNKSETIRIWVTSPHQQPYIKSMQQYLSKCLNKCQSFILNLKMPKIKWDGAEYHTMNNFYKIDNIIFLIIMLFKVRIDG